MHETISNICWTMNSLICLSLIIFHNPIHIVGIENCKLEDVSLENVIQLIALVAVM